MLGRRAARLLVLVLIGTALLLLDGELALTALPALLLAAVPLSGWFVGERLILARAARPAPRRGRAPSHRWPKTAAVVGRWVTQQTWSERGPPLAA